MSDAGPDRVDIVVQPLSPALLDGVDTGQGPMRFDLAVLPCFEDERPLQGLAGLVDWRTGGALSALLRDGFYTARAGEDLLWPGRRTLPMRRLVLLGLGRSEDFDRSAGEAAGRRIVQLVGGLRPQQVLVAMPGVVPERAVVEAVFDGLLGALDDLAPVADAQIAALAVGDEAAAVVVESSVGDDAAAAGEEAPRALGVAPTPDPDDGPDARSRSNDPDSAVAGAPIEAAANEGGRPVLAACGLATGGRSAPGEPVTRELSWWIVADPRHEARLRRLLEGPPRAADPTA